MLYKVYSRSKLQQFDNDLPLGLYLMIWLQVECEYAHLARWRSDQSDIAGNIQKFG